MKNKYNSNMFYIQLVLSCSKVRHNMDLPFENITKTNFAFHYLNYTNTF